MYHREYLQSGKPWAKVICLWVNLAECKKMNSSLRDRYTKVFFCLTYLSLLCIKRNIDFIIGYMAIMAISYKLKKHTFLHSLFLTFPLLREGKKNSERLTTCVRVGTKNPNMKKTTSNGFLWGFLLFTIFHCKSPC